MFNIHTNIYIYIPNKHNYYVVNDKCNRNVQHRTYYLQNINKVVISINKLSIILGITIINIL